MVSPYVQQASQSTRTPEDVIEARCHGCFGKGWVEVRSTYPGHDKAVICPVCRGTGKKQETDSE